MGKISELLFPIGLPIAPNVKTLGTRYAGPLAILKLAFEFIGSLAVLRSLAAIPLARARQAEATENNIRVFSRRPAVAKAMAGQALADLRRQHG